MAQIFHLNVGGQPMKFAICAWVHERYCELEKCSLVEMFETFNKMQAKPLRSLLRACAEFDFWDKELPIPSWPEKEIYSWIDENGGLLGVIDIMVTALTASVSAPGIDDKDEPEGKKKKANRRVGQK